LKKGKRQRESWEGAAVNQAVFAIRSSILNRMSFLAGFAELGRPAFSSGRLPRQQGNTALPTVTLLNSDMSRYRAMGFWADFT
jgi:hypothetical protein